MVDQLNTELARKCLYEAASDAWSANILSSHIFVHSGDPAAMDAHLCALRVLIRRVGWLVEKASAKLGETSEVVGVEADAWLLPESCGEVAKEGQDHV